MNNEYATKQDLREMETRPLQFMEAMENRLVEHIAQAVQDAETRILKATYHYIETVQSRIGGFTAEVADVKTRMALMEQRVLDIEKRLNLGPQ